jgi:hypothetical protein
LRIGGKRSLAYIAAMKRALSLIVAATLIWSGAPAFAGAGNFTIVNATGIDMTGLAARRYGTETWEPIVIAPLPIAKSGGRGAAQFKNEDCAFDLRATLPNGQTVIWPGVNLCETHVVTLNRDANGNLWVDYQ